MRMTWPALLLLASIGSAPAFAADMPVKAPMAAPMVAVFDWSGLYGGLQGGYGWGRTHMRDVDSLDDIADTFDADGWAGGGTLGFNAQSGAFVGGVEGDLSWSSIEGGSNGSFGGQALQGCIGPCAASELNWFGTLRLRGGFLHTPTALVYLTGGAAYGDFTHTNSRHAASHDDGSWGWTVGAGAEASLGGQWTGKIEYLYLDFGRTRACTVPPCGTPVDSDYFRTHLVRLGVNYRFGTGGY